MIDRRLLPVVLESVETTPVVALLGPRQVGKTTLALEIAAGRPSLYLDLENEADRARLDDPGWYLREHPDELLVLDEIHRVPDLFRTLRGVVDERRRAGRRAAQYLILGSAGIDLLRQSGESLAGRIAYHELCPFDALETIGSSGNSMVKGGAGAPAGGLDRLWLRGGFPDSWSAASDRASHAWRLNFIRTYLQRDIPEFGPRIPAETLRRFWTMLAHLSGGLLNTAALSRSLGVDNKTITRYLDLMVDLLLVRRLQPWHRNVGKRLVKSPRLYVRDSGLLHALLDIADIDDLAGHPKIGESWEGFVVENLLSVVPDGAGKSFYRTAAGAEIDLVLELGQERWAIEIKRSGAPTLSRGFFNACEDIAPTRRFVLHSGDDAFRLRDGIEAWPLPMLMQEIVSRTSGS